LRPISRLRVTEHRDPQQTLPLAEERLNVTKRTVESERVRVRTVIEEREEWLRVTLARSRVDVERVPVNREVASMPLVREEGDVLIVPVVEEVLVVEKRLVLKEELHLRRVREEEVVERPVVLRSAQAVVEKMGPQGSLGNQETTKE